jgi:hypothetical protein
VSEIVQSERAEPGGATVAEERLGNSVRLPRGGPPVVAEHEPVGRGHRCLGVFGENRERVRVEVDHVAAFGLRCREHRAVGAVDPAGAERHPVRVEVHVVPSQSEELCASRAGEGSEERVVAVIVAIVALVVARGPAPPPKPDFPAKDNLLGNDPTAEPRNE